jgi:hypothetical protein
MRSLAIIGGPFIFLFAFGFYHVRRTERGPTGYVFTWLATRSLSINHQILPGDLSHPREWLAAGRLLLRDETVEGMHLMAAAHQRGDEIRADEMSQRPKLVPHSRDTQVYFYVLKQDSAPAEGWTEGASVIPCYQKLAGKPETAKQKTVCIHTPLPILAIHTAKAPSEASWLALEVPASQRCTFADFALAEKRPERVVFKGQTVAEGFAGEPLIDRTAMDVDSLIGELRNAIARKSDCTAKLAEMGIDPEESESDRNQRASRALWHPANAGNQSEDSEVKNKREFGFRPPKNK